MKIIIPKRYDFLICIIVGITAWWIGSLPPGTLYYTILSCLPDTF